MNLVKKLEHLDSNQENKKIKLAVIKAANKDVLEAVKNGLEKNSIQPILIDDKNEIIKLLNDLEIDVDSVEIIDENNDVKAAMKGVSLAREGKVEALMKGFINTSDLLKEVVNKETGIRSSSLLSHVAVLYIEKLDRFVAITDGGMVVEPDKKQLEIIIDHGVQIMHSLNIGQPKVSLLSMSESVIPSYDYSVWAKELSEELSQENYTVEGPLSFDLSISPEIVEAKGYQGKIKGDADVLVVPNIVVGNTLSKSLILFGESEMAGLIIGAQVPIILTSRTSSKEEKYGSVLLAQHYMNSKNR